MKERAETIRKALKSVNRKKRNTPYPLKLRRRAAAYIHQQLLGGTSWNAIASSLDISVGAVKRWHQTDQETKQGKDFLPVRMTGDREEDNGKKSCLVFVTPSGYRVEGLSVEDIATLLRVLA